MNNALNAIIENLRAMHREYCACDDVLAQDKIVMRICDYADNELEGDLEEISPEYVSIIVRNEFHNVRFVVRPQ